MSNGHKEFAKTIQEKAGNVGKAIKKAVTNANNRIDEAIAMRKYVNSTRGGEEASYEKKGEWARKSGQAKPDGPDGKGDR